MSSRSRSTKSTTNNTTSVNSTFDGENNFQFVNSTGNEVVLTDHGAIEEAFDAFDTASGTVSNALATVKASTDNTVTALKDFATQLTVGDVEGSKWIALAIVVAVVVISALYFFTR